MPTTIQISENIKERLDKMKFFNRETYNDVIERMIEDDLELNEKTKIEIEERRKEARARKVIPHEEVKKRFGM